MDYMLTDQNIGQKYS